MELLGIQLWKCKRMNLNVFGLKRDPTSGSTCWWWLVRWVRNSMIYSSSNILHKYMKLLTCEFVVLFRCYQLVLSIDTHSLRMKKKKLQLLLDGLIRFFLSLQIWIFLVNLLISDLVCNNITWMTIQINSCCIGMQNYTVFTLK
jgi:hypothetical protein